MMPIPTGVAAAKRIPKMIVIGLQQSLPAERNITPNARLIGTFITIKMMPMSPISIASLNAPIANPMIKLCAMKITLNGNRECGAIVWGAGRLPPSGVSPHSPSSVGVVARGPREVVGLGTSDGRLLSSSPGSMFLSVST